MRTTSSPSIPTMSVEEVVVALSGMYVRAMARGTGFRALPSVMLWGPPGVGKSEAIREVANELGAATGKVVTVTDIRLLLYGPTDLRGIPVGSEDRKRTVWLRPQVFEMDDDEGTVNILFLDEISAAPPSVQAAAYQLVLEGAVGEHRLPDNCVVVAAGNRVTDRGVAYRMPKPLANRMLHIEVAPEYASWRRWAVRTGVSDKIIAFLSFRPDRLMDFDAASDELAFASPRSWAKASETLNGTDGDIAAAYPLVCGLVGVGVASELRTWCRVYGQLPDIDDVFSGKARAVPKGSDALYALTSAMAVHARTLLGDPDAINHSIAYAQKLPADFSVMLLKDYLALTPDSRLALMRAPGFAKWAARFGGMLNGSV